MPLQQPIASHYVLMNDDELARQIHHRRSQLQQSLLILAHHYQQDDIIQHADIVGDSLKLAQTAAALAHSHSCPTPERHRRTVVLCGVRFMAETATMLAEGSVRVILPNLSAGCSMADMADIDDAHIAWDQLHEALGPHWHGRIIPITYINSSAAIKAFVGERGGACCTSSNAAEVLSWALNGGTQPRTADEEIKVLFLPDQHLGRNTAAQLGLRTEFDALHGKGPSDVTLWDPQQSFGGLDRQAIRDATILLWAGHCSVHMQFRAEDVDRTRREFAASGMGDVTVMVHPECRKEVVDKADLFGSTERMVRAIESSPRGSNWAIGTEVHLVNRMAREAAKRGVHVRMLSHCPCLCSSMFRINPAHLLWVLDKLAEDEVVNQIVVPPEVAIHAVEAIKRMLDLTKPEYERVGFRGFTTFPERARTPGYVKTCPAKCEISHQN